MTTRPRRPRRETAEAPRGIGGEAPFPLRGPITALRVLGHDSVITLDPDRAEFRVGRAGPPMTDVQLALTSISGLHAQLTRRHNALEVKDLGSKNGVAAARTWLSPGSQDYARCEALFVNVGDCFALGSVGLLALDEPTHQLVQPLTAYCGAAAHDHVDHALQSMFRGYTIVLCGSPAQAALELAQSLHAHSIRKDFPFTTVRSVPDSESAIESLCTQAGCGTILLDLTTPFAVPPLFTRHLLSTHFHLWTIVIALTLEDVSACLGEDWFVLGRWCHLGFPRKGWHRSMADPRFTTT